jgi:Transcriptional activator of glycolytic enzymes
VELSKCPRSLLELWNEWVFGLDGRKAAKDFNRVERGGKSKTKFCRRKVFWDCVSRHVAAGFDVQTVIDKIQAAYGYNMTMYRVLEAMTKDKKKGGHPNLRI